MRCLGLLQFSLLLFRLVSASTGPFIEGEESQVEIVNKHGVGSLVIPNEVHLASEKLDSNGSMDAFDGTDVPETDVLNRRGADHSSNADGKERTKRLYSRSDSFRWPKAIIPFIIDDRSMDAFHTQAVYAAFTRYQKYTCFRFVPWVREKFNMWHDGRIKFAKGRGCNSYVGKSRTGQTVQCCRRTTCLHELGHAMGLMHEERNNRRQGFLRVNYEKMRGNTFLTFRMIRPSVYLSTEYDVTSRMHSSSNHRWLEIMYEDLQPLSKVWGDFYMFRTVSRIHDCQGVYCSNFSLSCENDGFVTLVDNSCACLCPPGLDPATGCTKTFTHVSTSPVWPKGPYALLAPKGGCPGSGVFATGRWKHYGKGPNYSPRQTYLAGNFTRNSFEYEFCVKSTDDSSDASAPEWETGNYCILRADGACPNGLPNPMISGFKTGYMQFDDSADEAGSGSGQLPDGNFSTDTRLEFCCRDDGFTSNPLSSIPNTQPLILFPNIHDRGCQQIAGMRSERIFVEFADFPSLRAHGGELPLGPNNAGHRLYYCYYAPLDYSCGGAITLNSNNRQVQITSPNFPEAYGPNLECNWLIKAENQDDRVVLNFHAFKTTSGGRGCLDTLEIRYNLPGQPGIRYCGDGLSRTIRSLNNTIILTFRSDQHQVQSDTGFNLTASLHSPATDECYEPATKGVHYRGRVDYTRSMKPCIPWASVPNCRRQAFKASEFGKGLVENYCRNPDNTVQPWCYTDASKCSRDYCDVCGIERVYDTNSSCPDSVCSEPRDQILKTGCAATCRLQVSAPIRNQTCGQPVTLTDGEIVEPLKASYSVGETITYKCRSSNQTTIATCLSEGEWSPIGYVCGGCTPGWAANRTGCYKVFDNVDTNWTDAERLCRQLKPPATLTSLKDLKETKFVESLRIEPYTMFVGARFDYTANKFLWRDGTPLGNYSNWKRAIPHKYRGYDCVSVAPAQQNSLWDSLLCDDSYPSQAFGCKYSLSARTSCKDREDCPKLLQKHPDLCSQYPDFASHECALTCAVCDSSSD